MIGPCLRAAARRRPRWRSICAARSICRRSSFARRRSGPAETLDLLLAAWTKKPALRYERELYLADWPVLLASLKKAPARASPLLLVGHNPGMEQLAVALALQPKDVAERARLQRLTQKFPTAALAVLDFEIASWRILKPGWDSSSTMCGPRTSPAGARATRHEPR